MRLLHLHGILSMRMVVPLLALTCLLLASGVGVAHAQSKSGQSECGWDSLLKTACYNAQATDRTAQSAQSQKDFMEKSLRKVDEVENVPAEARRDVKRKIRQAIREMGDVSRSARDVSRSMERICGEKIVLRNRRSAAKKYDDLRQEINSAARRFNGLRDDFTGAIKLFNEALTDLAMYGSALPQIDTTQ